MSNNKPWIDNFKKFLLSNNLDSKLPEKVVNYLDGIYNGFVETIKKQRLEIDKLKEERAKLLRTLENYSEERADAILKLKNVTQQLTPKELLKEKL